MIPYCNITKQSVTSIKYRYTKLLKSPLWFLCRDNVLKRDDNKCIVC